MQALASGVHYFQDVGFQQHKHLFERLAKGQKPVACFITCSDSRIDPNLITNTDPGQLFIVRNIGNLVPCYGAANNGELAAVEYAVTELGVRDIIVCGHTSCGAMLSLLKPERVSGVPSVQEWLRHADATTAIIRDHYAHLSGQALLTATAEENVLVQLGICAPRRRLRRGWRETSSTCTAGCTRSKRAKSSPTTPQSGNSSASAKGRRSRNGTASSTFNWTQETVPSNKSNRSFPTAAHPKLIHGADRQRTVAAIRARPIHVCPLEIAHLFLNRKESSQCLSKKRHSLGVRKQRRVPVPIMP